MELVRAPYLLDHRLEQQIYDARMAEAMARMRTGTWPRT